MKKRSLTQLKSLYQFTEHRERKAQCKGNFQAANSWHQHRIAIADLALSEYTAEEFL